MIYFACLLPAAFDATISRDDDDTPPPISIECKNVALPLFADTFGWLATPKIDKNTSFFILPQNREHADITRRL